MLGGRWRSAASPALASVLLHGGAVLALAALHRADPLPAPPPEQEVEIVWQSSPEDSAPGEDGAVPPASAEAEPQEAQAEEAQPPEGAEQASLPQPPPEPALAEASPPEAASEAPLPAEPPAAAELPPPAEPPPPQAVDATPSAEPPPAMETAHPPEPAPPPAMEATPPRETPSPLAAEAARPLQELRPPDLPLPPPTPPPPAPPRPAPRQQQQQQAASQSGPAPARQAAPGPAAPPDVAGSSRAVGAVSPPRLLEGVRNPEPEYPFASRQRGDQGVVTVRLGVSATGDVMEVEVVASSGHPALDDSARRAVQRWRFRPAMQDGVPVAGSIRTAVHFRLQ